MKLKFIIYIIYSSFFIWNIQVKAQTISGIINSYYQVTNIATSGCGTCIVACSPSFTVASATGLSIGDKVLVIQMQVGSGASINSGVAFRFLNTYGQLTNSAGAGTYEFATIGNIIGSVIQFASPLLNTYDVVGNVQLVKIPVYTNVSTTGTVTGQAWNGSTGGVLVIEVAGTLTMNHNFDMNYKGFRGGVYFDGRKSCCNGAGELGVLAGSYYFSDATIGALANSCLDEGNIGAYKGEGVFPLINNEELGKGAFSNGGGGGSGHNAGGGGGGNISSGGNGGWEFQPCTAYAASDMGGRGGYSVSTCNGNFIFMGGGAGAGQSENDNTPQGRGGNGAGIIIIKAASLNVASSGLSIIASGENGGDSFSDAAGGGGAGGSILLSLGSTSGNTLFISANGGEGGHNSRGNCCATCHGPGGGGGGGRVYSSSALTGHTISALGGISGLSGGLISAGVPCAAYGAIGGNVGASCTGLTIPENSCALPVIFSFFNATNVDDKDALIQWNTIIEEKVNYYEVLRSQEGLDWHTIGMQEASFLNYNLYDHSPIKGLNYYRLKIVDNDGSYSYSDTKTLFFGEKNIFTYVLVKDQSSVYNLILHNYSSEQQNFDIIVYNINGQKLETHSWLIERGESKKEISLDKYSNGIYYLKILTNNSVSLNKVQTIK